MEDRNRVFFSHGVFYASNFVETNFFSYFRGLKDKFFNLIIFFFFRSSTLVIMCNPNYYTLNKV